MYTLVVGKSFLFQKVNWTGSPQCDNGLVFEVGMFCQSSSVYLTVFISLERWVAVCTPLKAKHICTQFR